MNDLYDLLVRRRTVRLFEDREIPEPLIEKMMDAVANAASGGNLQPLSVILVKSVDNRRKLAKMLGNQPWIRRAPLSMVFCLDFSRMKDWAKMCKTEFRGEQAVAHFLIGYADLVIAAQSVALLAEDSGLASVFIGRMLHEIDATRKFFDIPRFVLPMMVLTIGYPKAAPRDVPKLRREVIFHAERYRAPEEGEIRQAFDDKYGAMEGITEKYIEEAYADVVAYQKEDRTFLEQIMKEIKQLDIRNNAQFLFKFQYPSHVMSQMNHELLQSFKNAGFEMFSSDQTDAGRHENEASGSGESDHFHSFPEIKE
jgi:nitroreductase